ncbi:MAG: thermosome subunit alpha [Candidatus Woesearchaeota archaeon]
MTDKQIQSAKVRGQSPQKANILAARIIAQTIQTTLGPKGMDKVLVDSQNNIIITNDGATILRELAVDHPVARMMIEIAQTQEEQVGDGTTTAVILAGELLKYAQELLDKGIHPTIISQGYRIGAKEAIDYLRTHARQATRSQIESVAKTAMTGKGAQTYRDHLSSLCTKALPSKDVIVQTRKVVGNDTFSSELFDGVVLDKFKVHPNMPDQVTNAKVAFLDCALEVTGLDSRARINIANANDLEQFVAHEKQTLTRAVEQIKQANVTAVFCMKGIDQYVQHLLAKQGILAIRRMSLKDMSTLSQLCGARIVNSTQDLDEQTVGTIQSIQTKTQKETTLTYLSGFEKHTVKTLVVHGTTPHIVDEMERAIDDALGDIYTLLKNPHVLAGAGATESMLAKHIRQYARTLVGKEQLAVEAFARSFEIIPTIIAQNAGLDAIEVMTKLAHKDWVGVNVETGAVLDPYEQGIIEPLQLKIQAITGATDVATMILRIDDIIFSSPPPQDSSQD